MEVHKNVETFKDNNQLLCLHLSMWFTKLKNMRPLNMQYPVIFSRFLPRCRKHYYSPKATVELNLCSTSNIQKIFKLSNIIYFLKNTKEFALTECLLRDRQYE